MNEYSLWSCSVASPKVSLHRSARLCRLSLRGFRHERPWRVPSWASRQEIRRLGSHPKTSGTSIRPRAAWGQQCSARVVADPADAGTSVETGRRVALARAATAPGALQRDASAVSRASPIVCLPVWDGGEPYFSAELGGWRTPASISRRSWRTSSAVHWRSSRSAPSNPWK